MSGRGREALTDVHDLAAGRLAVQSQRYTLNRRKLVDALIQSSGPLTIDEILGDQQSLAQSSTYRNLVVLEQAGVVHRIITADDHARFELDETITGRHHHHLICEQCGVVLDVTLPTSVEDDLVASLGQVAREVGFTGRHHRIDLVGDCHNCDR
jgi:Fe2+ or Zn2+ uptake regulation protein